MGLPIRIKMTEIPTFKEALENGTIVEKSSYHQNMSSFRNDALTTDKGAYRDAIVKMPDNTTVYIYHKTPIVIKKEGTYILNNGGWETSTTKERINRYIPSGYYVRQKDFTWYLETPDNEQIEFKNGMVIEV